MVYVPFIASHHEALPYNPAAGSQIQGSAYQADIHLQATRSRRARQETLDPGSKVVYTAS